MFLWAGRIADHAKRFSRAREPGLRRLERIRERRHLSLRQLLQWEAGKSPNGTETCTLTTGGELPVACRDEFIARAHNARHSH